MSMQSAPKRIGRPPKPPGEKKVGSNLTIRMRGDLRERLNAEAKKSELSVTEEVERRIERSFEVASLAADLKQMIAEDTLDAIVSIAGSRENLSFLMQLGHLMVISELTTGKNWREDEETRVQIEHDFRKYVPKLLRNPPPPYGSAAHEIEKSRQQHEWVRKQAPPNKEG